MSPDIDNNIETETTAHIRPRDLRHALDLLEGLQRILSCFHAEQRARHEPDPLLDELRGIHGHGYNWEALSYQEKVGEGWFYIAASTESLRARLELALANDQDPVPGSTNPGPRHRKGREIGPEIVGQREGG